MLAIDIHQHLWSEPLIDALAVRDTYPRVRRDGRAWRLELQGEPASYVPQESAATRAAAIRADGLDRALIALSSALGVESLSHEEAEPLLAAHAALAPEIPDTLGVWAATSLTEPGTAAQQLPDKLANAVGLCLPAGALATPAAVEALAPVLEALERTGKPLLVHPGPAAAPQGAPSWWPALADYIAQQQAAWLAFAQTGRPNHPKLKVVFAALAGLAPLHAERIVARGGPIRALRDADVFYDTSSYGSVAIDSIARVVGRDQLVHGSDRPVVDPPAGPGELDLGDWRAMATVNPARLLAPVLETAA